MIVKQQIEQRPQLRIWTPCEAESEEQNVSPASAHRIGNSVRGAVRDRAYEESVEESLEYAANLVGMNGADVIPKCDRKRYRATTTLRLHYLRWMRPSLLKRIQAGSLKPASEEKIRSALAWFERVTRPAEWPAHKPWAGLPLALVSQHTLQQAIDDSMAELSPAYLRGLWYSLRIVINDARRRRVMPQIRGLTFDRSQRDVVVMTTLEIETAFRALASVPTLQVAFVVGINTGLRPVDLFLLRWEDVRLDDDWPMIVFQSRKTSKLQGIPLAPVTVAHLRRLPRVNEHVFPGYSSASARAPEKSRAARRRTDITKSLYAVAGLQTGKVAKTDRQGRSRQVPGRFYLPWQPCRPTCNERLHRVAPGSGDFVLGHSLTLNATSYRQPTEAIRDAILKVPQPPCFLEILGTSR